MGYCCLVDVLSANETEGKDTQGEDVERTVVHSAEASLPVKPNQDCQTGDEVDDGEPNDEEVRECLQQGPGRRIHRVVPTRCVRLQHRDQDEENECQH